MDSLVRMTPTFSPSPNTAKSRALWERARQVAPMGAQGEGKYYAPFPHFVARAKGAYLCDADDNRYIDYWNGAGPCILGHVDEHVESRVADVVRTRGVVFCAPNEVEVELCETLARIIPCAEMSAFLNAGSDVLHMAARLARAATGRNLLVKFAGSYHGWCEDLLFNVSSYARPANNEGIMRLFPSPPASPGKGSRRFAFSTSTILRRLSGCSKPRASGSPASSSSRSCTGRSPGASFRKQGSWSGCESFARADLAWRKPAPLIPRDRCFEVDERLSATAAVVHPIDRAQVEQVVRQTLALNVEGIAVSLLHAYRNNTHERVVEEVVRELAPDLPLSLSSAICREVREYERTNTTVANVYSMPRVRRYVEALQKRVDGEAVVSYLSSEGGIQPGEEAAERPVSLCVSGPAGGVLGGAFIG